MHRSGRVFVSGRWLGGYANFIVIKNGRQPGADLLDSLSQDAEHFAVLFDGTDVCDEVAEQFDDALVFHRTLILTSAAIAEPLRGHDLGAWLVSEVIARMAGETDTLVLLYPFPTLAVSGDTAELEAVDALARHWQRVGLVPIEMHPEFLGHATAYSTLAEARQALGSVRWVKVSVPASQLREQQPHHWPRTLPLDA